MDLHRQSRVLQQLHAGCEGRQGEAEPELHQLHLDEDTKKRLAQGERIVEVLKQGEHQPLKVENQVMIIHAVTNDLLSDIPVNNIARFETELFQFININYPEIGKKILENGDFTQELTNAIKEFKKKFVIEA